MAIQGFLESVSEMVIKGWCIDTSHDGVVDVEVRIGSISLGSVHADLYRRDLHEKFDRSGGGFRFRISPKLLSLLPARAQVTAFSNGEPLGFTATCDPYVENPEADGENGLERLLADGYFVSPKSGGVHRPVRERWTEKVIFESIATSNSVFKTLFGKDLFICYGTLLGCIRDGDFIAHDDDVDVCFLSDATNTEDAAEDFAHVVRALRARGERVRWPGSAHFHWNRLDVFIAWFEEGKLYMYNAGGECARDAVLPLRSRTFLGHRVLVPRRSEMVLQLIYGSGWRTPDPMFQWRVPTGRPRKAQLVRGAAIGASRVGVGCRARQAARACQRVRDEA